MVDPRARLPSMCSAPALGIGAPRLLLPREGAAVFEGIPSPHGLGPRASSASPQDELELELEERTTRGFELGGTRRGR